MHILVVHAMVILLTLGPPRSEWLPARDGAVPGSTCPVPGLAAGSAPGGSEQRGQGSRFPSHPGSAASTEGRRCWSWRAQLPVGCGVLCMTAPGARQVLTVPVSSSLASRWSCGAARAACVAGVVLRAWGPQLVGPSGQQPLSTPCWLTSDCSVSLRPSLKAGEGRGWTPAGDWRCVGGLCLTV